MLNLCPTYHIPVLLHETIDALQIQAAGRYADLTFGGGGHSREILNRLGREGHLFCFDQDADAQVNIPEGEERLTFVHSNFRFLKNWMRYYGVYESEDGESGLDGIIADLGVSSHHFDDESRGFSFRFDAPLDMRMNGRGGHTAAHILNTATREIGYLVLLVWRIEKFASFGCYHSQNKTRATIRYHGESTDGVASLDAT